MGAGEAVGLLGKRAVLGVIFTGFWAVEILLLVVVLGTIIHAV